MYVFVEKFTQVIRLIQIKIFNIYYKVSFQNGSYLCHSLAPHSLVSLSVLFKNGSSLSYFIWGQTIDPLEATVQRHNHTP
jgi:hypothetical protein